MVSLSRKKKNSLGSLRRIEHVEKSGNYLYINSRGRHTPIIKSSWKSNNSFIKSYFTRIGGSHLNLIVKNDDYWEWRMKNCFRIEFMNSRSCQIDATSIPMMWIKRVAVWSTTVMYSSHPACQYVAFVITDPGHHVPLLPEEELQPQTTSRGQNPNPTQRRLWTMWG